ncbi:MAG: type IV secretory system conjugative DNA transfer family protein [Nitrospirae bacterium]|nr:type IV secretory system conjugative DNA transfer family protein [Nitrospirota bacterium]
MALSDIERVINKGFLSGLAESIKRTVSLHVSPSQVLVLIFLVLLVIVFIVLFFVTIYSRGRVRIKDNPATSGRFASHREILSRLTIPGKARLYAIFGAGGSVIFYVFGMVPYYLLHHRITVSPAIAVMSFATSLGLTHVLIKESRIIERKTGDDNFFQIGAYRGRRIGINKKRRQEGILIPGPPGSGKTSSFMITNIINDSLSDCSVFCVDVKPDEDIVDIVGNSWWARGRKVINFDPYKWKMHFNPLMMIESDFSSQKTHDAVKEIINALFGSYFAMVGEVKPDTDHFIGREYRLIWAVIMAVLKMPAEYRNLNTVLDAVKLPPDELTRFIASTGDRNVIDEFRFFADTTSQERVNAMQGLYRKLQFMDGPTLRQALIRNDFDIEIFFNEPCLFVVKAEMHRDDMKVMASMIARLLMLRDYEKAAEANRKGVKPRPAWFYLDEFARLNLPKVDEFAATGRSSEAGLTIYVQDKSDIEGIMKKMKSGSAQSFISSLRTIIVLPGCSYEMCQEISLWLGETSFNSPMKSRGVFDFISFRYYEKAEKAPLITADNIHYMDENMCLVLTKGIRPFFAKQIPYYKDGKYKNLLNKPFTFYMPESTKDIKKGEIADLLKERAADVQGYMKKIEKAESRTITEAARDERATAQSERAAQIGALQETEFPMDSL